MKVYQAIVITTLLYAGDSWTIYSRHARQLNKFHMSCLCKLLRIKWQDNIPNTEVLSHMGMPSIYTLLSKAQVRWVGHVSCISNEHLPKRLLYGKLLVGKCPVDRPKMHFKDSLKMSLKNLEIPVKTWERLASDWSRCEVRSQEESWLLKTILQLRPHTNKPKENPEPQATCRHTKPVNHRCDHHHQSMDKQHS